MTAIGLDWTAPCCPHCGTVGVIIDQPTSSTAGPKPKKGEMILFRWPQGSKAWGYTDAGSWAWMCGCDWHDEDSEGVAWPTLRSCTPAVVVAFIEEGEG